MKRSLGLAAALALAVTPLSSASAAGVTKSQIAAAIEAKGYNVAEENAKMLSVVVGEHRVVIAVDGSDADVSYMTFLNDVRLGEGGHKFLSRFNSEVKFGRAYIDRDGDVVIQMDRNSSGGVSLGNIESDFEVFLLLISKFLSDYQAQGTV